MLNKEKHQLTMGKILRDIYYDTAVAPLVGFKGGTCAYLFYGLPRFSVDLDFDMLRTDEADDAFVFERVKKIAEQYGTLKESYLKYNMIFLFLSYGPEDRNIKIEINRRSQVPDIRKHYSLQEYLGISLLVASKPYLFSCKLAALTSRRVLATRDIYDIWYFSRNLWDIDVEVLKLQTGRTLKEYLPLCISTVEKVSNVSLLQGLGELLNEKQKAWVKQHLRDDVLFYLKFFLDNEMRPKFE